MKRTLLSIALFGAAASVALAAAAPKRLLVVTANSGFRHSSIELTEKVIRDLAAKSGEFVVISTMDHPDYPDFSPSANGALSPNATFGRQLPDATPGQQTAIRKLNDRINSPLLPTLNALRAARTAFAGVSLNSAPNSAEYNNRLNALMQAETAFAQARATHFAALQASDNRLSPAQLQAFLGLAEPGTASPAHFAPQVGAATPLQQKAIAAANAMPAFASLAQAVTAARSELLNASLGATRDEALVRAKVENLASAELALATARSTELARIQTTAGRFQPAVLKTLVSRLSLPLTGSATADGTIKIYADMLNAEALKNYDGVYFVSTVGTPFPDLDGLIKWVNDGGAWLGNHAATDTTAAPRYFEMIGGHFTGHGSETREVMTVMDTDSPIGKALGGKTFEIYDEMYTFESALYDQSRVHSILSFTSAMNDGRHFPVGAPGHWPSTWTRNVGKGRVFYTALGHREDVVSPDWPTRMNPPEVARAFQAMLLEGIRFGLGITPGDATPQVKVPTPAGGPGVGRTAPAAPAAGGNI